ncbi:MAG TPA: hypothetical protein VF736_10455 [Pyrinomonadaceae bacterium]|jgi:hypothetical protein
MALRNPEVPVISYVLAPLAGLFGLPFMFMAAVFLRGSSAHYGDFGVGVSAAFGLGHLVLGGAFGFLWPEAGWRWGVWLCAAPACIISYLEPDAWFFVWWLAMTALPACAGAQMAAWLHLKYTEVG